MVRGRDGRCLTFAILNLSWIKKAELDLSVIVFSTSDFACSIRGVSFGSGYE